MYRGILSRKYRAGWLVARASDKEGMRTSLTAMLQSSMAICCALLRDRQSTWVKRGGDDETSERGFSLFDCFIPDESCF